MLQHRKTEVKTVR